MWRLLPYALTIMLALLGLLQPGQAQQPQKETIRAAATQTLSGHYPERTGHLKVRVRRLQGTVDTSKKLRLRFSKGRGTPAGPTQASLHTQRSDGEWEDAGWALLDVTRLDSVATVRGRMHGDEPIPPSKLETAWIETTGLRGEPIQIDTARSRARRGNLVATRHLQSGRVLQKHDVRRPHTVDAGSPIHVVYRRGRLVFRVLCTARESGGAEETIRVHCADLKTMYRARITSESTAEWVETLR